MVDKLAQDYSVDSAVMKTYGRAEISFVRGQGCWLESEAGEQYLDCSSGIAVNTLGHAHPQMVSALIEQGKKLWHVSNLYRIPEQENVAKSLARLANLSQVFFCNSGVEATEAAVKIARRSAYERGEPDRTTILCADGAFHGRTLGMLAATDRPIFRRGFGPIPSGFEHSPLGDLSALRAKMGSNIAAIMVEPIQGEGGVRQVSSDFLVGLRNLADEFGALLIADEVQAGIGRSGSFFSYEFSGIQPDIVAVAKGLGGGFPIGAVITSKDVGESMSPGTHGSTFGGNPLAMAVAKVVIDIVSEKTFLKDIVSRASYLEERLVQLYDNNPGKIIEVRGRGFLRGIRLADDFDSSEMVGSLRRAKVLAVPAAENTVRLLPPLIISREEIDFLMDRLKFVMTSD